MVCGRVGWGKRSATPPSRRIRPREHRATPALHGGVALRLPHPAKLRRRSAVAPHRDPCNVSQTHHPDPQCLRSGAEFRVVRGARLEEGLGVGHAAQLRRGEQRAFRDFSVSRRAGWARAERSRRDLWTGLRRVCREGRVDVGLGRRCGCGASRMHRTRHRGDVAAHRHAVERARNASPSSGWTCVPHQPEDGIRARNTVRRRRIGRARVRGTCKKQRAPFRTMIRDHPAALRACIRRSR